MPNKLKINGIGNVSWERRACLLRVLSTTSPISAGLVQNNHFPNSLGHVSEYKQSRSEAKVEGCVMSMGSQAPPQ